MAPKNVGGISTSVPEDRAPNLDPGEVAKGLAAREAAERKQDAQNQRAHTNSLAEVERLHNLGAGKTRKQE